MTDMQERQETLQKDVFLVAAAGLSLINGQSFSPIFDPVAVLLKPFIAGTFLSTPLVFLYLASIFVSAMTLLIAGVPAAVYERFKGQQESSAVSMGIWFCATLLLVAPTLIAAATR
jgi:hypothetical protein